MVIATSSGETTSGECSGRIVVDESDYRFDEEKLPFEIKEDIHIRRNEKFSKFYECFDEIGEGKFGKVYRCREKATGLELAAKWIKIRRDADRAQVEKEVAIMTQMRHPRIAQIYDAFSTPENDIILIMEVVQGGELFDRVVDENYVLTEMAVVMIICQLCEAVAYIHSKNIVHLDIKPENIMCVSQSGNRIKLIDFGLAQYYDGSRNLLFMAGTPEFVAPEVVKFEPIDFHTDMWSIGVITYILLSGISPFLGDTSADTYCAVEKGEWEFDDEAFEGISEAAKDFISKLLVYDQKKRMLPEECLNHRWIVGSRAKAANDHILSLPNTGKPISKEGLKSYLKNKRFRKGTLAVVFLLRFKKYGPPRWKFVEGIRSGSAVDESHAATSVGTNKIPTSEREDDSQSSPDASESCRGHIAIADNSGADSGPRAVSVEESLQRAVPTIIVPSEPSSVHNKDSHKGAAETILPSNGAISVEICEPKKQPKNAKEEKEKNLKSAPVTTKAASTSLIAEIASSEKEGKSKRSNTASHEAPTVKTNEHPCKGSAVSALLSMFSEKAEAAKRSERRPPRAVRTLRDVERPPKKPTTVTVEDSSSTPSATSLLTTRTSSHQTVSNTTRITQNDDHLLPQSKALLINETRKDESVLTTLTKTTHDANNNGTTNAQPAETKRTAADTESIENPVKRLDSNGKLRNSVRKKEKQEKKVREPLNVRNVEEEEITTDASITNEKSNKASADNMQSGTTIRTKTSVKVESKTCERSVMKLTNGQLTEENQKKTSSELKVNLAESKIKSPVTPTESALKSKGERQSRIAQFHSVALQAETQKKISSPNPSNGPTVVKIDKTENLLKGKIRVGDELKDLDGKLLSKKSATLLNEVGDQRVLKSVKKGGSGDMANEKITESVRGENLVALESSKIENGVKVVEEVKQKSVVSRFTTAEKPPSGRSAGDKKRNVATKKKERDKENSLSEGETTDSSGRKRTTLKKQYSSAESLASSVSDKEQSEGSQKGETVIKPNGPRTVERKSDEEKKVSSAFRGGESKSRVSAPVDNRSRTRLKGLLEKGFRDLNDSGRVENEELSTLDRRSWRTRTEENKREPLSYGTATTSKVVTEEGLIGEDLRTSLLRRSPVSEKFSTANGAFSREQLHERSTNYKVLERPGFALSRNQSESDIAARARASSSLNWVQMRRQTIEEEKTVKDSLVEVRHGMSAERGKAEEEDVTSFGYLKMKLQSRIQDAQNSDKMPKVKSEQVKMPLNSAKQAISMWQTMDKKNAFSGKST